MRRVQLEGSRYADRPPIGTPAVIEKRAARTAGSVLPRLVPARPDGGDRRRRRGPQRRGGDDPAALLVAREPGRRTAAAGVRRARPRRHAVRGCHRQGEHRDGRAASATSARRATRERSAAIATIMLDQLFAAMLGDRLDETRARARIRRSSAPAPAAACSRRRGRGTKRCMQALVSNDGVTRGLDALVTELQRVVALRLHRHRTRSREAGQHGRFRARGRRRAPIASRRAAPTSTRATSCRTRRCRRSGRNWPFIAGFIPAITLAEMNALAADWFPEQNRLVVVSAPEAAGVVLPDEAQLAAVVAPRRRSGSRPTSTPAPGRR